MEYPTILTVIATALAILGFMWRVDARWQDRFDDMQKDWQDRFNDMQKDWQNRFDDLQNDIRKELSSIKERVAHVEGMLSGAPGRDQRP